MALKVVIRGKVGRLRTAMSFGVSGSIHAALLAWLMVAAAIPRQLEHPKNIYDQEIKPYEKHIVWYNLRDKLPDVSPASPRKDRRQPRARRAFNQSIVAGEKDDTRPPQLIRMPAPAIQLPRPLPLPNVLAIASPRPVRTFQQPPVERPAAKAAQTLPDAPQLRTELKPKTADVQGSTARPVRPFAAPLERTAPKSTVTLPDAPQLHAEISNPAVDLKGGAARPVRAFTAPGGPPSQTASTATVTLPEAPRMDVSAAAVTLPVGGSVDGPRRAFTAPAARGMRQAGVPVLPDAPQIAAAPPAVPGMPRIPRAFTPPASGRAGGTAATNGTEHSALPDVPGLTGATPTPGATASLAIVGLTPANTTEVPSPPGSHEAGFSAGPKLKAEGGDGAGGSEGTVVVPGLLARGGEHDSSPTLVSALAPPTSRQNLLAALHGSVPAPGTPPPGPEPHATRVATAPDPRLRGRLIYTVAIQMPNVTSYSGSWIVWFAEHDPKTGAAPLDMRPPTALRKVDPKYIQAAVDERVEGIVRLSAIIRKTGHVERIELLQHLDERLDRTAAEALGKWEFEPAKRDGDAIDIDAVFEIPFRLAPKPKR